MWFKHSMSIAQQLIPICNITVQKNKGYIALNVVNCLCHKLNKTNSPRGEGGAFETKRSENQIKSVFCLMSITEMTHKSNEFKRATNNIFDNTWSAINSDSKSEWREPC